MRVLAFLALCLLASFCSRADPRASTQLAGGPRRAHAQDTAEYGATSSGLCGFVRTGAPRCGRGTTLSASAGYAVTLLDGRHDRGSGSLGVAVVPLDWLALSLELAGRIDAHPRDELGRSVTATGDPYLRARLGVPIGQKGLSLGGELGIWLPGREAPSFRADAISPELKLLLALRKTRLQLLALLGARIDQSFRSAPDLERLRKVDRVTLGLSDSHALLLGLGLGYTVHPRLTLFSELSGDLLLGKQAPSLLASPTRIAVGARYFAVPALAFELTLVTSLSRRPGITARDPLVPIEPRVAVNFGVRATFGKPKSRAPRPAASTPEPPAQPSEPPPLATLSGMFTDAQGEPLPEVQVTLLSPDGQLETITDAQGRYSFEQLHEGKAELRASAAGFTSARWEVEIKRPQTRLPTYALEPGESTGILRCLVRSFESAALTAVVTVRDERGRRVVSGTTDNTGSLELSLSPGEYRVMIEAAGYRSQRTQVQVAANEVAILNVDMRKVE